MNLQEIVGGIEMIPKVIHYCWFGYGEKSALVKKCIQSWREKFPNYEIKEWNESNFDVMNKDIKIILPLESKVYDTLPKLFISIQ